ncbi:MAG: hypothetical protein ACOYO1_11265 [Bacteroidales bacterium]
MDTNKILTIKGKKKSAIFLFLLAFSFNLFSQNKINIYIENSGSMKGFFELGTNCDNTISNIKTNVPLLFKTANLNGYLINDAATSLFNLNNQLNNIPVNPNVSTPIPDMLKKIIDGYKKDDISLFISDFIYNGGTTSTILNRYKNEITQVFSKFKYDCLVLKLYSNFKGTYWAISNQPIIPSSNSKVFPYYIFIFGNSEKVLEFYSKIKPQLDLPNGFNAKECLFYNNPNKVDLTDYQIQIGTRDNKGKIECTDRINKNALKSINLDSRSKELQIPIKVKLNNIKLTEAYLTDSKNYTVIPSNYTLEIKPTPTGDNYSHLFLLKSNSIINQNISITLNKIIPDWCKYNILKDDNDSDILTNTEKTFGFSYLMKGIAEKYCYKEEKYDTYFFKIQIPFGVNSPKSKPSTKLFYGFFLLLGVGGAAYYFYKKSKK